MWNFNLGSGAHNAGPDLVVISSGRSPRRSLQWGFLRSYLPTYLMQCVLFDEF